MAPRSKSRAQQSGVSPGRTRAVDPGVKQNFDKIIDLLLREKAVILTVLSEIVPALELDNLAKVFVEIFAFRHKEKEIIKWAVRRDVRHTSADDASELFRANTIGAKVYGAITRRLYVSPYLTDILTEPIKSALSKGAKGIALDPNAPGISQKELAKNRAIMVEMTSNIIHVICNSTKIAPTSFKEVAYRIRTGIEEKFKGGEWKRVLADVLFLRFVVPAITAPAQNLNMAVTTTPIQDVVLLQISKLVQASARGAAGQEFDMAKKQPWMEGMADHISSWSSSLSNWYNEISTAHGGSDKGTIHAAPIPPDDALASVATLIGTLSEFEKFVENGIDRKRKAQGMGKPMLKELNRALNAFGGALPHVKRKRTVSQVVDGVTGEQ